MYILRIFFALLGLVAVNAWADSAPIGSVRTVSGEAFVVTGGSQARATPGLPVYLGSQLKTGAKGSLGVVFNDASVMSFGSSTDLTIDAYLYQPASGKSTLATNLLKGSMNYLSGSIAKLKPDSVSLKGPTGTLGVRGTQVLMLADGARSFVVLIANPDGTVGSVLVQGNAGNQLLSAANQSAPLNGALPPAPVDLTTLQNTFGEAINALPPQPALPVQGAAGTSASTGTAAGAQAGAFAIGGISGPVMVFGAAVLGAVVQSSQTSTATGTQ